MITVASLACLSAAATTRAADRPTCALDAADAEDGVCFCHPVLENGWNHIVTEAIDGAPSTSVTLQALDFAYTANVYDHNWKFVMSILVTPITHIEITNLGPNARATFHIYVKDAVTTPQPYYECGNPV